MKTINSNIFILKLLVVVLAGFLTISTITYHSTRAMFHDTEILANNTFTAGYWENEDEPNEQCLTPDTLGDDEAVQFGDATPTLQDQLDSAGYTIDAENDQKNYQVWHSDGEVTISLTAEFISAHAGNSNVFGYYRESDLSTFEPLFQAGDHSDFPGVPEVAEGDTVTTTIPASTTIGFATHTEGTGGENARATEKSLNEDGKRFTVVYDHDLEQYIIAFEDVNGGDDDYNDMIVRVAVDNCEEEEEEEEEPEVGPGDVVINEVMWMGSSADAKDEWIELRNMTDEEIDIGQWNIENGNQGGSGVNIPASHSIPAGGFYLIAQFNDKNPTKSALAVNVDHNPNVSLANNYSSNGVLVLRNASSTVIDQTPVADSTVWPEGESDAGEKRWSMQRGETPGDGTDENNWYTCDRDVLDGDGTLSLMENYWKSDHQEVNCGTPGHMNLSSNDPTKDGYEDYLASLEEDGDNSSPQVGDEKNEEELGHENEEETETGKEDEETARTKEEEEENDLSDQEKEDKGQNNDSDKDTDGGDTVDLQEDKELQDPDITEGNNLSGQEKDKEQEEPKEEEQAEESGNENETGIEGEGDESKEQKKDGDVSKEEDLSDDENNEESAENKETEGVQDVESDTKKKEEETQEDSSGQEEAGTHETGNNTDKNKDSTDKDLSGQKKKTNGAAAEKKNNKSQEKKKGGNGGKKKNNGKANNDNNE